MKYEFGVESSSTGETYDLIAFVEGSAARFSCTCEGAKNGRICKHRRTLLEGRNEGCISGFDKIDSFIKAMKGTDIHAALVKLVEAEKAVKAAQIEVADRKMALARIMTG